MAYKMKGSKFFGKGEKSPFKVSDEAVVAAQDKLDHIETDWKEPGWAKAARGVYEAAKGITGASAKKTESTDGMTDEEKKAFGSENEADKGGVADIAKKNYLEE